MKKNILMTLTLVAMLGLTSCAGYSSFNNIPINQTNVVLQESN